MKKIYLASSILLLFALSGCLKEDFPVVENITKGSKWNLHIGESIEDIYKKLQELGIDKNFSSVSLVYRRPFKTPAEIRESLPFYHVLSVISSTGRVDRVMIHLENNRVTSLAAGGALPGEVDQWPRRAVEGAFIQKGDSITELHNALKAIHQTPEYQDYQYQLSDKPLDLSFDPDMKNYNEWAFTFSYDKKDPGRTGRSQVRLFFKNGRLDRIHHVNDEFEVVY